MSVSKYLNRLPVITYDDKICRNLRTRVTVSDTSLRQYALFHPYTLKNNERADTLAYKYYDESDYAWLVYLANNIVDPYKSWPLTDEQLVDTIVNKYGSVATAQAKVLYYRVNWASDDTQISVSRFNSMPDYEKKYWAPMLNSSDTPIGYQRKRLDMTVETNQIVYLTYSSMNGTFNVGDFVTQGSNGGWVSYVGETFITLKQVTGTFTNGSVTNSSATAVVYEVSYGRSYNYEHGMNTDPVPTGETTYWEAVTAYAAAFEENEMKKIIQLIDASHTDAIESELNRLLPQ